MKLFRVAMVFVVLLTMGACGSSDGGGGGGGGGTAATQAETAFDSFVAEIQNCIGAGAQVIDEKMVEKQATLTCDCTGSGTMVIDLDALTLTVDECTTAAGEIYDGVLTTDAGGTTLNGTMDQFGSCSSASATNVLTATCGGTVSVTCPAGTVTCTIQDSAAGDETCDLSC